MHPPIPHCCPFTPRDAPDSWQVGLLPGMAPEYGLSALHCLGVQSWVYEPVCSLVCKRGKAGNTEP